MLEFNVSQVRELKGAPLSVIAQLSISPLPVSQDWLARSSGYTDKPIHQACQYLQEQGLIEHTRLGWFMPKAVQALAELEHIMPESILAAWRRMPYCVIKSKFEPRRKETNWPQEYGEVLTGCRPIVGLDKVVQFVEFIYQYFSPTLPGNSRHPED